MNDSEPSYLTTRERMAPADFVRKWRGAELKERAAAQEHFIDLCRLFDHPTPAEADPAGEWFCFEKGASKYVGGGGWADVWKRGYFGWEYKSPGRSLDDAYIQLQQYSVALENPPLLIVSDLARFRIYTNWTNSIQQVHEIALEDLLDPARRGLLEAAFVEPERLRPGQTRQSLTEDAADRFARLALGLRQAGHDPHAVAHFVNRLVFCMFAEDVDLLPNKMFRRMLEHALARPDDFLDLARDLFRTMQRGGRIGFEPVEWFNGGLFDSDEALPLGREQIEIVLGAARLDWSDIDPSILGTLFERGLDPDKRSQLGAHYTDRDKIMLIVEPVVMAPLRAEWDAMRAEIAERAERAAAARGGRRTRLLNEAASLHRTFLDRLRAVTVLDPACGSGNFLYLALLALKDFEHRVNLDAETLGLPRALPSIGPECVKGIEINPYAAELARVTVWIGEIQWMRRNGFGVSRQPILRPLDTIECRDALLNEDGTEATWPAAEFIVGNPPFLGGKLMRSVLGDDYVDRLFAAYRGRVSPEADLVCYWFAKAWNRMADQRVRRVGLVSTNSIRGGANRDVLDRIVAGGRIFSTWADEPWVVEGAAVRVSLVCFARQGDLTASQLNGLPVTAVYADLTGGAVDLTCAARLAENRGVAFMGDTKGGAFDVPGDLARSWLQLPLNANGRPNADVLRPWVNGMDLTRRSRDMWIIDFGWEMTDAEAALYEAPFRYVERHVKPVRQDNRRELYRNYWWRHVEPRPGMWGVLTNVSRYIGTARVGKHRLFVWLAPTTVPDSQVIAIARDDDTSFGILHSRFHELWSLRLGTWLGKGNDPRYTPSTTFETFPFPAGLTPDRPAEAYAGDPRALAIAAAARRLVELRDAWLNPPDLMRREPEVVPGFPDRILPLDERAAGILKKRTLTNLYNERPTWLAHAHQALDAAVAAAFGWEADISDDEALTRLLALNQERAA